MTARKQKPQPTSPQPQTIRKHAWRVLLLFILVLAAYSNSFDGALVFDSSEVISKDPRLTAATPHNVARIFTEEYWPDGISSGLYRPATTLSYLFNYAILDNGQRPAGYHSINAALHCLNVSLVYLLGVLIFGESLPALFLAALWGLHPLLTESVTNIVGRADLLSAFGVLAGLLCYLKFTSVPGHQKFAWLAGLAAAQTIGLFSKENAVVLPALLLLYDLTMRARANWRARAPAYAALILPFVLFFYLRSQLHAPIGVQFVDNPLQGAPFWTARLTAVKVIGKYLWLFLWPAHLSADYSYSAIPLFSWNPANWENLKTLIALAVCIAAACLLIRASKPLRFFALFFFIALIPASNLIVLIGSIMAERFVYLPSIGLAGCLAAALYRFRKPALLAVAAMTIALAARTYARNLDWSDDLTLWTSTVQTSPQSFKAHLNLGNALLPVPGRLEAAAAEYQVALQIKPDLPELHNNLANALVKIPNRLPDAIKEYQAALRLKPDYADAHDNLGVALTRVPGRLPDAIAEYRTALRLDPANVTAHSNLGSALSQIPGSLPEAIAEYRAALRLDPSYAEIRYNLANALAQTPGTLDDAIAEYRTVLQSQPASAPAHCNLGIALAKSGRLPAAIAEFQATLRIDPDFVTAHFNLARALSQIPGRMPEAIAEYEAVLRLNPDPQLQNLVDRLRAGQE